MNILKPMKTPKALFSIIIFVVGVLLFGYGIYSTFFEKSGFVKTTATVTSVEEEIEYGVGDEADTTWYVTTVTYTVDGREYTRTLDMRQSKNLLNQEITVLYNPKAPGEVKAYSPGLSVYLLAAGGVLIVVEVYVFIRRRMLKKKLAENGAALTLSPVERGEEEREVYFVTDLGTAKGTCRIEDAARRALYEAKCTRFSLVGDTEYEFIDHENNRTTPHFVSKTYTQSSSAPWVIDNHSSFSVDGKDIWDFLHENGVTIETGLNGLKWAYGISLNGEQIAEIAQTSQYVHEEDEEAHKALGKIPVRGFYRVHTKEKNLEIIFLTLFAIGRTDMMLYD